MSKINAATVKTENTGVIAFDPSKVVMKKRLVVPTISLKGMKEGDSFYFRADGEIKMVEQTDEKTGEIKEEKLPVLEVYNLADNMRGQIVLGAIIVRALKDEGELTGRAFAMQKGKSLGVGKANLWELVEIEA